VNGGRQRAGDGSQQVQVAGDLVVVHGVTEERALEIATDAARSVLTEYSRESAEKAQPRIDEFNVRLVREMGDQQVLDALSEPAMQVLLRRAQLSASSTEREDDYELLARLVSERAKRDTRPLRVAVDRAVQVIDSIDEPALQGLTASWALTSLVSTPADIDENLDAFESLFVQLPLDDLPVGTSWLDDLDLLDLVRVSRSGLGSPKKFDRLYGDHYLGFTGKAVTPEVESEFLGRVSGLIGRSFEFCDAGLQPGLRRPAFPSRSALKDVLKAHSVTEAQVKQIEDWMNEAAIMATVHEGSLVAYGERLRMRPTLRLLADWWDTLTYSFARTSAGTAVAYVNAGLHGDFGFLPPLETYLTQA
jgi:hypothetical protein